MPREKATVASARGPVRNWTEEEKDVVWEQTCLAKEKKLPLTEAFRKVARLLPHRSEAAVGMLYYNVLRKERGEHPEEAKPSRPQPEFKVDAQLIAAFQGLPEYMRDLNQKIKSLEERQKQPDPNAIINALTELVARHSQQDQLGARLQELQAANTALQETNQALQEDLEKLKQAYDDALGIYDMFTNMASISQIMSLGDFKQQMKTTLDKWGNVLKITFDRSLPEG